MTVEQALVERAPDTAELRRTSPAAHLATAFAAATVSGPRGVAVRELAYATMIGIRVTPGAAADRIGARLGAPLPAGCGVVADGASASVLWLGPDEFLAVSEQDPAALTRELVATLDGAPGSVVDLSANRTTLELSGPSAIEVLMTGCPLDLHPRVFAVGTAYATTLGGVPLLRWRTGPTTYRLLPRSSFADHVGRWLVDAMTEFAVPLP